MNSSRQCPDDVSLDEIAANAALRRTHHDHRLAVVARSKQELAERLTGFAAGRAARGRGRGRASAGRRPRLAFVCSGQGPQWWAMGRATAARGAGLPRGDRALRRDRAHARRLVPARRADRRRVPLAHGRHRDLAAVPSSRSRWRWRSCGRPGACGPRRWSATASARWRPHTWPACSAWKTRSASSSTAGAAWSWPPSAAGCSPPALARGGPAAHRRLRRPRRPGRREQPDLGHALGRGRAAGGDRAACSKSAACSAGSCRSSMPSTAPRWTRSATSCSPRSRASGRGRRRLPLFSTVTGRRVEGPELGPEYWWQNVRQTVRFADGVERLIELGCDTVARAESAPGAGGGGRPSATRRQGKKRDRAAVAAPPRGRAGHDAALAGRAPRARPARSTGAGSCPSRSGSSACRSIPGSASGSGTSRRSRGCRA